ncbi:DedA family protein [Sporolactobacillus sp. CPB3-1]|uniref:DedA family protein n=1 Tax=Sporolactobacillus mangiferae TaxID=2940498 RepID=A0ABT0MB46_9BACL|nr:DedA family protein [Sporolactobacillus mangiferae]MCL1632086.1 DedA family protein [Sporolactobacillus mangiferae]
MQNWIISFMEQHGYFGVFLMIFLENIFPPIPSEVILTFGGFMTTRTQLSPALVILFATAGSVAGAAVLYAIGRLCSVDRLESIVSRWGGMLRLKSGDLTKAGDWFQRYGYRAVFFCRTIPLIRSLISIPAGMSKMSFSLFMIFTCLGTLIWNSILVLLGAYFGNSWNRILEWMEIYAEIIYVIIIAAAVIMVIYLIRRKRR